MRERKPADPCVLEPLPDYREYPLAETCERARWFHHDIARRREDGTRFSHCCSSESVGIASGFLIAALHHAGPATLTHTPDPMKSCNAICGRPAHERPTILLVVGYPRPGCRVPVHGGIRKPLEAISSWIRPAEAGMGPTA